jgi:small subunit ribosomal protein S16
MAVRIRLMRMGKKKQPTYRVVVVDGRKPRNGRYIELIGRYDPRQEPSLVEIDNERALDWLHKGAQPSETAQKLLTISGAWTRFQVAKGLIPTIGEPTAPAAPVETKVEAPPAAEEPTSAEAEAEADSTEVEIESDTIGEPTAPAAPVETKVEAPPAAEEPTPAEAEAEADSTGVEVESDATEADEAAEDSNE